jgi:hypothetical protein
MQDDLDGFELQSLQEAVYGCKEGARAGLHTKVGQDPRLVWGTNQSKPTHRDHRRRVEQKVTFEDGQAPWQDVCAVGKQRDEERKEREHLGRERGRTTKEHLPEFETIFLQVDV